MAGFLLGPIYPVPSRLLSSPSVRAVTANLSTSLVQVMNTGHSSYGNFVTNSTSLSITALSTQDMDNHDSPFFDFHFSSPFLNQSAGSTETVTSTSLYRIGSISKLFTVYTILVNHDCEYWDDSVTEYLPELAGAATLNHDGDDEASAAHVDWSKITVGNLASHLSGIGRDYSYGDLASTDGSWSDAGLPSLSPDDIPQCGGNSSMPPCNRDEYFRGILRRAAIFAPQTTPVYSNTAYRMLGYILEALSGTSFSGLLESSVLQPLNLTTTTSTIPSGKRESGSSWVIPNGESGWFQDTGDETPTSGMFSSSSDLASFGRAILLNKQLSPITTRRWMKPNSHTSSLSISVGSPWEILRTKSQISRGRVVDLYTKSGSINQYNSLLVLIPDYSIALSILTAGPDSAVVMDAASEIVLQGLIPALEDQMIHEACKTLYGTYESADQSNNSSLTIAMSADGDGLQVQRWTSRGVDFLAVIQDYASRTGSLPVKVRLQATNLEYPPNIPGKDFKSRRVAYRAVFEKDTSQHQLQNRIMDQSALWSSIDTPTYGGIAVDQFIVHLNSSGSAVAIEPRVLRDMLHKVPS
ncbi:beta-lactamase/transpeptidase-like protein [Aspergillus multicolor]|uniref:serine hydrolase domain-containing protein n=1 Tax=Aspergillus multicolor TaxID=41759 RepID=UPI003CCDBF78